MGLPGQFCTSGLLKPRLIFATGGDAKPAKLLAMVPGMNGCAYIAPTQATVKIRRI